MPKVSVPIAGVDKTVTQPVIQAIADQLIELTGMPKGTTILFPGEYGVAAQPGSRVDHEGELNRFGHTDQLQIEAEEDFDLEQMVNIAVHEAENPYIIRDDLLQLYVRSVMSSAEVTLNVKFRAKDKDSAIRWRNHMRSKFAKGFNPLFHRITYSLIIPAPIETILRQVHTMREAVAGYGESFEKWFSDHAAADFTTMVNLAGQRPSITFPQTQLRVQGYFDFDSMPEKPQKGDNDETWTCSFAYRFRYDKPSELEMHYPLVVHNQLMPEAFCPKPPDLFDFHQRTYSKSMAALQWFEKGRHMLGLSEGFAIPAFDEFIPAHVSPGTLRIFTALIQVDTSENGNPLDLLDLNDLGDNQLHQDIITFLQTEYLYLNKPLQSAFAIHLYRNNELMADDAISVDSNLHVIAKEPLNLRCFYHVRFSLQWDLTLINKAAQARLRKDVKPLCLIAKTLGAKSCPVTLDGTYVTQRAWDKMIEELNFGMRGWAKRPTQQNYNTVQFLTVCTSRK